MFGIENGLCEKSIFLSSSFHSNIGKSTIQQISKRSCAIRFSSSPTLVRAEPANLYEILRLAGDEETGVADLEAELIGDLLGALRPDVLGERARAALLAFAPEDVAEARLAFALRPGIHAVGESAVAAGRRRNGPDRIAFGFQNARENLEAGAAERFADVLHLDRVAQVRLVGAVFADGLGVRDQRKLRRHRSCLCRIPRTRRE